MLGIALLQQPQVRVLAGAPQQVLVAAPFDAAVKVHDDALLRPPNEREALRDDESGSITRLPVQFLLYGVR